MDKTLWFKQAKFGLFIHWGLYSLLERGEWVMYQERITPEEYATYAEQFDPGNFDMDSLCAFAVECGMKYAVFTTCHHEGFAMFDSKADSFNSMNAPCHRDFVAEFVKSCRKHGLKVGLYYSLGDWRFGIMKESDSAEKAAAMRELTFAQVRELMTNYGKIDILWYDGGWCFPSTITDTAKDIAAFWHAEELNAMVRSLQPDILINNRSGLPEDFSTPEGVSGENSGKCCEACFTLSKNANAHWGFFRNEKMKKTKEDVIELIIQSITSGYNLLVNVGPDRNGVIPEWQTEILHQTGAWLKRYPEVAFNSGYTDAAQDVNSLSGNEFCSISENREAIYCLCIDWPDNGEMILPVMKQEIAKAVLLNSNQKVSCTKRGMGIKLSGLPTTPPDPLCSVIKLIKKI